MIGNAYEYSDVVTWAKAEAAKEGVDYAYTPEVDGCMYVHNGKDGREPGCLIGRILLNHAGVTLDVLIKVNTQSINRLVQDERITVQFTPKAISWMNRAQIHQDNQIPWKLAIALASDMDHLSWDRNENYISEYARTQS